MLGINVDFTISATFFIGSVLAGVAGVMAGPGVQPDLHADRLRRRAEGVHRRGRRRHRVDHRRGARRLRHRPRRVVLHRLRLAHSTRTCSCSGSSSSSCSSGRPVCSVACNSRRSERRDRRRRQQGPDVGVDEWVARSGTRREYAPGWRGGRPAAVASAWAGGRGCSSPPSSARSSRSSASTPTSSRSASTRCCSRILALGLNVSVGWAGLLDLGYIAFYGFGAYGFALLSSSQLNPPAGIHLRRVDLDPDRDDRWRAAGARRRASRRED